MENSVIGTSAKGVLSCRPALASESDETSRRSPPAQLPPPLPPLEPAGEWVAGRASQRARGAARGRLPSRAQPRPVTASRHASTANTARGASPRAFPSHEPVAEAREILQRVNPLNFEFPLYHVHSRLTLTAIGKMDGAMWNSKNLPPTRTPTARRSNYHSSVVVAVTGA